jgi:hypothetical protein
VKKGRGAMKRLDVREKHVRVEGIEVNCVKRGGFMCL